LSSVVEAVGVLMLVGLVVRVVWFFRPMWQSVKARRRFLLVVAVNRRLKMIPQYAVVIPSLWGLPPLVVDPGTVTQEKTHQAMVWAAGAELEEVIIKESREDKLCNPARIQVQISMQGMMAVPTFLQMIHIAVAVVVEQVLRDKMEPIRAQTAALDWISLPSLDHRSETTAVSVVAVALVVLLDSELALMAVAMVPKEIHLLMLKMDNLIQVVEAGQ
jgi:hypothetical protein